MEKRVMELMNTGKGHVTVVMNTGIAPRSFTKSGGFLDCVKT
jgi:hypothetical protein